MKVKINLFFSVMGVYGTKCNKTLPDLFLLMSLMSLVNCFQRSKAFNAKLYARNTGNWYLFEYLVWKPVCAIFEQSLSRSLLPLGMTVGNRAQIYNFSTENNDTNGK